MNKTLFQQLIRHLLVFVLLSCISVATFAQPLASRQQDFVDLRLGMSIHYKIPTCMNQDWANPGACPEIFNPKKLNTD